MSYPHNDKDPSIAEVYCWAQWDLGRGKGWWWRWRWAQFHRWLKSKFKRNNNGSD